MTFLLHLFLVLQLLLFLVYSAADVQFYVVTRDNVALNTLAWFPYLHPVGPYSMIYEQTPYGANNRGPSRADYFSLFGYAYMIQDVRGQHGSNGTYSFFRSAGNDSIDTIQYFYTNEMQNTLKSNGELGNLGISASCLQGYGNLMGVTQCGYDCYPNNPNMYQPYLELFYKQLTGVFALGDGLGRETVYQGGAYRTGLISNWLHGIGQEDEIDIVLSNEAWSDWWYDLQGNWEDQWNIFNQPMVSFAGWYDIFGQNQIETIITVNETAESGAAGQQLLIVDPGGHCPLGDIIWEYDLFGWEMLLGEVGPTLLNGVFTAYEKNQSYNIRNDFDWNVLFYVLGPSIQEEGLFWVKALNFPEYNYQKWFLTDNGGLSMTPQSDQLSSTTYTYDPSNPLPTWGGNNLEIQPCGPWDQNHVEDGRSDVLHFDTPVFNTTFAFLGPFIVNLYVSSSAVDTDFTVKVIDVFANGKAMLIQDTIQRMRWRNGLYEEVQAPDMEIGEVYPISVNFGYINWVFNPGHKLRISISSSNYPRFSVNYNSGLWVKDGNESMVIAQNTVWYGLNMPSSIQIPMVDLQWLIDHKYRTEDWVNPNPQVTPEMVKKIRDEWINEAKFKNIF